MILPTPFIIFVCVFGAILLLRLLRFGWMTHQARAALRVEMAKRGLTVTSVRRRLTFGPHHDTIWEAFWALTLDYDVKGLSADGDDRKVWFKAFFAPVIGRLRSVQFLVPKRALGDKGGWEFGLEGDEE